MLDIKLAIRRAAMPTTRNSRRDSMVILQGWVFAPQDGTHDPTNCIFHQRNIRSPKAPHEHTLLGFTLPYLSLPYLVLPCLTLSSLTLPDLPLPRASLSPAEHPLPKSTAANTSLMNARVFQIMVRGAAGLCSQAAPPPPSWTRSSNSRKFQAL